MYPNETPVLFHNGSNYSNYYFIIKELAIYILLLVDVFENFRKMFL